MVSMQLFYPKGGTINSERNRGVWLANCYFALTIHFMAVLAQKRPALNAEGINALIDAAESDEERYLYVLLAATGMRVSEALALKARHFINSGRTIVVEQQVGKDRPLWSAKIRFNGFQLNVTLLHCVQILGNHGRNNNSPETGKVAELS